MTLISLRNPQKTRSGFTLIEILMTLGIVSILLITLTQVFGSIISLRVSSNQTTTLAQDSRYLLTILEHDLISASSLSSPATNTSGSSLILQSRGETISYSYASNVLTRSQGAVSALVITESTLSSFVVSRGQDLGGLASVSVTYTLSTLATSDSPAQSRTFHTTYALRSL